VRLESSASAQEEGGASTGRCAVGVFFFAFAEVPGRRVPGSGVLHSVESSEVAMDLRTALEEHATARKKAKVMKKVIRFWFWIGAYSLHSLEESAGERQSDSEFEVSAR
jgi:hypothetical protein